MLAHCAAALGMAAAGTSHGFSPEENQRDVDDRKPLPVQDVIDELEANYAAGAAVIAAAEGKLDGLALGEWLHGGDVRDALGIEAAYGKRWPERCAHPVRGSQPSPPGSDPADPGGAADPDASAGQRTVRCDARDRRRHARPPTRRPDARSGALSVDRRRSEPLRHVPLDDHLRLRSDMSRWRRGPVVRAAARDHSC